MTDETWQERRDRLANEYVNRLSPKQLSALYGPRCGFLDGYLQGRADGLEEVATGMDLLQFLVNYITEIGSKQCSDQGIGCAPVELLQAKQFLAIWHGHLKILREKAEDEL